MEGDPFRGAAPVGASERLADPEAAGAAMRLAFCEIDIRPADPAGRFGIDHAVRAMGAVLACEQDFAAAATYVPVGPPDFVAVTLPLVGTMGLEERGQTRLARAGRGAIVSRADRGQRLHWPVGGRF